MKRKLDVRKIRNTLDGPPPPPLQGLNIIDREETFRPKENSDEVIEKIRTEEKRITQEATVILQNNTDKEQAKKALITFLKNSEGANVDLIVVNHINYLDTISVSAIITFKGETQEHEISIRTNIALH